jgi:alanyl-tRNA synthetase
VAATGQIGSFRITGESSIGTGLRRIEAVTGAGADALVSSRLEALHAVAQQLGVAEEDVPARVDALLGRLRDAEKAARAPRASASRLDVAAALADAQQAGDTQIVVQHYPEADAAALRAWVDELRGAAGRFVAVAGGSADGTASLLVAASRDLAGEGFDAAAIVRAVAPMIGGGGGGRADLAQAGGRQAERVADALREAARLVVEALRPIESS